MDASAYILKPGWALATIPELIGDGGLFLDGDWIETKDQRHNGEVRLIQLADLGDGFFKNKSNRYMAYSRALQLNCTFLHYGDILVARMPEPLGRATLFPYKEADRFVTVVDVAIIRVGDNGISNKLLMHFINSPTIRLQIKKLQTGTTRKRISRGNLSKIQLPIPPFNEQIRIVSKIEEIFSELDQAESNLLKAQKQLAIYKQAFLKKSFEGGVTKEWREGNVFPSTEARAHRTSLEEEQLNFLPNIPSNWHWIKIADIEELISSGSTPKGGKSVYLKKGIPFIRSQNVYPNKILVNDLAYISQDTHNQMKRTHLRTGDVLLNITGASIGRCAFVPENFGEGNVNQHVCIIRSTSSINPKYLCHYLNSAVAQLYINRVNTGATREALTSSHIKEFPVPLCSLEEQKQIVAELEYRFTIIENLETTVEKYLNKSTVLRQSILKKAVLGELIKQSTDDVSAYSLLAELKDQRTSFLNLQKLIPKAFTTLNLDYMEHKKSIEEILKEANNPVLAKEVWKQSIHENDIEAFYAELKRIKENIVETREGLEIYLSLKDEN